MSKYGSPAKQQRYNYRSMYRKAEAQISGMQCALDAQEARIKALEEALRAIIERWDTPNWKDAEHTGAVINRARAALEGK